MTFLRPSEHPDELISDSLSGDLTDDERARLDAHLAGCPTCRETLSAFAEQRRLVSGMRHLPPPRDLGARVRNGIESGRLAALPWWRRPGPLVGIGASLATVAAGILAVVVFTNLRLPQVAQSGSPLATSSGSAAPTASLNATPAPTPLATPPSVVANANPVAALVYTVQIPNSRLELVTAAGRKEIALDTYGAPTDATLSPDADWVAFKLYGEGSGLVDTYAYRISDGTLVPLTQKGPDSPFLRFAWSPDGRVLAYTALAQDGTADVWLFYPSTGETLQLTQSGATFASSFEPGPEPTGWLWVSVAAEGQPTSYRLAVPLGRVLRAGGPIDPAAGPDQTRAGAFLPMLNSAATPTWAAVWRGEMARDAGGWHFARGGMLYMVPAVGGSYDLGAGGGQVFSTLTIQQNGAAFTSARFDWAPDGDGFAIWNAQWTGTEEGPGFPDSQRVYFGHVAGGGSELITAAQALDAADTQGAVDVVDVALGGGQYLALTLRTGAAQGNEFAPAANLVLVTRHTGTTPDEVRAYGTDGVWNGPALYPANVKPAP
jgi:putative zinc finger protein